MQQEKLKLAFGILNGPQSAPTDVVKSCSSYKHAIRLEWSMRRIKSMTQSQCAVLCGFHAPHFSQWLKEDGPDMPAKFLKNFHSITGWTLGTQYLAMQAGLTVMEEVQANIQAERSAA